MESYIYIYMYTIESECIVYVREDRPKGKIYSDECWMSRLQSPVVRSCCKPKFPPEYDTKSLSKAGKVMLFSSHCLLGNCCCLSLQPWSNWTSMQQMYETWQSKFGQGAHTACVLCSSCRLLKGNIFISITAVICSFSGWCPDKYPIEKLCIEYEWAGSPCLQLPNTICSRTDTILLFKTWAETGLGSMTQPESTYINVSTSPKKMQKCVSKVLWCPLCGFFSS